MQITPLPPAKEVAGEVLIEDFGGSLKRRIEVDRDQAYTSLVEGIEGMKLGEYDVHPEIQGLTNVGNFNQALDDIIEKLVKPLYGKE